MRNLFWKTFYRIKFGSEYNQRMQRATMLGMTIDQSTKGNLSSFYNTNGERIRGWHRRIKFNESVPTQHPLITKYNL